ncbi:MAG: hypothetical protein JK586_15970 [Nocardiopsis sp. BM-2018]|nr:MAG: hypothetical protein JK586_15970 [Nocardiopsis sp. BM-2018]
MKAVPTRAAAALMLVAMLCFGVVSAQLPSGDPSPFIEGEIDIATATVETSSGNQSVSTTVTGKIRFNSDGLGGVLDAIVGALCRIFPCGGNDTQAQILLRTAEPEIGDARNGIVLGGGVVGIGEFFGGIEASASFTGSEFDIRLDTSAAVQVTSIAFARDTFLTEAYLEFLGVRGVRYVPAGTYEARDGRLRIPVMERR